MYCDGHESWTSTILEREIQLIKFQSILAPLERRLEKYQARRERKRRLRTSAVGTVMFRYFRGALVEDEALKACIVAMDLIGGCRFPNGVNVLNNASGEEVFNSQREVIMAYMNLYEENALGAQDRSMERTAGSTSNRKQFSTAYVKSLKEN